MTEVWTEERIEKLTRLYGDGYSFSEIAAALGGGISRNSAIGKAHRLGLSGNKSVAKPKPKPVERKPTTQGISAAVQKINQAKESVTPKIKPEPFIMQCAEIVPLGISLMDLAETTCRWPDGDTVITFCGHPAPDGPYCRQHTAIAFRPRYERKGGPHPAELGKHRGGVFGRNG